MTIEDENKPPLPGGIAEEEFVLVPRKPTEAISDAFFDAKNATYGGHRWVCRDSEFKAIYRAMLAAAPPRPMPTQEQSLSKPQLLGMMWARGLPEDVSDELADAILALRSTPVRGWEPIENVADTKILKIIGWCVFPAGAEARFCQRDHFGAWQAYGVSQRVTHFKPWPEDGPAPPEKEGR